MKKVTKVSVLLSVLVIVTVLFLTQKASAYGESKFVTESFQYGNNSIGRGLIGSRVIDTELNIVCYITSPDVFCLKLDAGE